MPKGTSAEQAEARAQRRRWLSLAEIVGLASVTIAGLGLWNSYAERRDAKQASAKTAAVTAAPTPLVLRGRLDKEGERMTIAGAKGEVFQAQTVTFPTALGVAAVATHADEGSIEARAFDDAVKTARKAAGREGDSRGEELLPVLVETQYLANGDPRTDRAVYDIAYNVNGGLFGSHLRLRGLAFVARAKAGGTARVDALWRTRVPAAIPPAKPAATPPPSAHR